MEELDRQKYLQLITRKLVSLTACCILILFIWFYIVPNLWTGFKTDRAFLVVLVFVAGLIGGFVSIQQRLPTISLNELRELSGSWLSILLIPINGGIFAIVLMLLFLSGILEGVLFPVYEHASLDGGFINWTKQTLPKTGPDIAKLLFWSFSAGFIERLVPQIIRKTSEKVDIK